MKICNRKNIVLALSLTLSTLLCTYQVALADPQSNGPNGVSGEGINNGNDGNSASGSPSVPSQNSPSLLNSLNMFESSGQGEFQSNSTF